VRRVGMKHVVRRVARPNGKFISQNLLAFDLSCVELTIFSFFFLIRKDRVHIYILRDDTCWAWLRIMLGFVLLSLPLWRGRKTWLALIFVYCCLLKIHLLSI